MQTPKVPAEGTQLRKLYDYLVTGKPLTYWQHAQFGIAGTAMPRRIKELRDLYEMNINTTTELHRNAEGKNVPIAVMRYKPKSVSQASIF